MFYWRSLLAAFLAAALSAGMVMAGSVTSGPQVGDRVPGPFKPLCVSGTDAGQAVCQYCKNGARPVAVLFAKDVTPALAQLIKKIDAVTGAYKEAGLGSYVVVCTDAAGANQQLAAIAQQMQIQNTVMTLYKAGGPEQYRLAPEADVTVLLYSHFTVKANHAFKNAELTEAATNAILADLGKMLAEQ
jgi:hypothetical protein